jgi:hypothetical protein
MTAELPPGTELQNLLEPIRRSIESFVFESGTEPLGAVTGLLAAIPSDLGERIGGAWAGLVRRVPDRELRRIVSHEDRLLVDLVLSMSQDRRSFASNSGADRA